MGSMIKNVKVYRIVFRQTQYSSTPWHSNRVHLRQNEYSRRKDKVLNTVIQGLIRLGGFNVFLAKHH